MTTENQPLSTLREIYDDIELAILFDWLKIGRPAALQAIDLDATRQRVRPEEASGPIRLVDSGDGYNDDNALANAVARMALSAIADRLPQWALVRDGEVLLARKAQPRREAVVDLMPRFLLMINWADSGPGFSWPESYHATYLPGFNRYVVTMSADSTDAHGYEDLAIGHFPETTEFEEGVKQVICNWWQECTQGEAERAWAYIFREGLISEEEACTWAGELWGSEDDEDQRDEEEYEEEGRSE